MNHDAQRRERFFYAEADAGLYDVSIGWVVPHYELLHAALREAVKRAVAPAGNAPFGVIDIGAGSGTDTLDVLSEYPNAHVVAVDLCRPMLDRLERKLALRVAGPDAVARCSIVHADALGEEGEPMALRRHLPSALRELGATAVISSLTVHHFEHAEKVVWLTRAYEMLAPGGFLILADLFSFTDSIFTEQWLAYDHNWMRSQFAHGNAPAPIEPAERQRLLDAWIKHYAHDNRLEPVESAPMVVGHADMMTQAGFVNVALAYRFSLSGILVGQRPAVS